MPRAIISILLLHGVLLFAQGSPQPVQASVSTIEDQPNSADNRAVCPSDTEVQESGGILSNLQTDCGNLGGISFPDNTKPFVASGKTEYFEIALNASSPMALSPSPMLPAVALANITPGPVYKPHVHNFFDRENVTGFAVHGLIRIADATQSCILLGRPNRRESWLPMQSCAAITGYSLSMVAAQIGASYGMHRMGHHTLERWMPYIWASPSVAAIGVSVKAW